MLDDAVTRNDVRSRIESEAILEFDDEIVLSSRLLLEPADGGGSRILSSEMLLVLSWMEMPLDAPSSAVGCVTASWNMRGVSVVRTHIPGDTRIIAAIPPSLGLSTAFCIRST